MKRTVLWASIPEVAAYKSVPYRSGNRIASRMRRKRREPRIEGNAPDHLSTPYVSNSKGTDYHEEDARYDNVDVPVVMRPDDGVDHELDEDPNNCFPAGSHTSVY